MYELGRLLNDDLVEDIEFREECFVEDGKTSTGVVLLECVCPICIDRADDDGDVEGVIEGVEARLDE